VQQDQDRLHKPAQPAGPEPQAGGARAQRDQDRLHRPTQPAGPEPQAGEARVQQDQDRLHKPVQPAGPGPEDRARKDSADTPADTPAARMDSALHTGSVDTG